LLLKVKAKPVEPILEEHQEPVVEEPRPQSVSTQANTTTF